MTVDDLDATKKFSEILSDWEFVAVLLAGVSFAGFNMINPAANHEKFEQPVIAVTRTILGNKAVHRALKRHFVDWRMRWEVVEKLGCFHKVVVLANEPPICVEAIGADVRWACNLVQVLPVCCRIPEPISVARLVAHRLS